MENLDPNFADLLRLLNSHGVKYLVIGGYAVAYHGFVRATGNLDVFVELSDENASRLVRVFQKFGFSDSEAPKSLFTTPGNIVRIGVPPIRLEVLNQISGVEFKACYKNKMTVKIDDSEINLIDLESLLKNKRAAGRPKDLADLDELTDRSD